MACYHGLHDSDCDWRSVDCGTAPSIYERLRAASIPLDSHESDLYAKVTPESSAIVRAYEHRQNVRVFVSQIDGRPWFDIPFAYQPFWDARRRDGVAS
jgi:hypothetical protein